MLTPEDADVLVAAAYLHDIGYAPALAIEDFHPLDGARWLADQGYDRLAGLVAHHSGAKYEAALRGLAAELAAYREENSLIAAALAYSDLTTGPAGGSMTPNERLADVAVRHGGDSPLRHSATSIMLAQGTPLWVVSEVLGHASVAITKDVYGHLLGGEKQAAAEAITDVLFSSGEEAESPGGSAAKER